MAMDPPSRASAPSSAAPNLQDAEARVRAEAVPEAAAAGRAAAAVSDYTRGKIHLYALSRLTTARVQAMRCPRGTRLEKL